MKHYAFLDVDNTLIYEPTPGRIEINYALLDELKAQGVVDVYLFTSMSMNEVRQYRPGEQEGRMSRYDLIEAMRARGFQIHGVITPADTGYHYEDGTPKPAGAAYQELYDPIMRELVQKDAFIDELEYSTEPELLTAFYRNLHRFDEAMYIERNIRQAPHNDIVTIPASEPCLVDRQTRQVTFVDDAGRDAFLRGSDEEKRRYSLEHMPNPEHRIAIKGNRSGTPETAAPGFDNIKGLMMQAALNLDLGPCAITVFDDAKTNLDSVSTVLEDTKEAGLMCFSTCLMSRNYDTATSRSERTRYRQAITDTVNQVKQREDAEKLLNSNLSKVSNTSLRLPNTRTNAAKYIRENLAAANLDQLAAIADLAHKGNERLFPDASRPAAMKCLLIAYLKATTPEQALVAKERLDTFLAQVGYQELDLVEYPFIDNVLNALKHYARENAGHSRDALDMVTRLISMQESLLASIPLDKSFRRRQEKARLQEWRDVLSLASKPNIAHASEQPLAASSSSSSSTVVSSGLAEADSEPSKTGKQFAFLDVDFTLLYDNGELNLRLLQTLLDSGITDVYLFTNMTMEDVINFGYRSADTRHATIKRLEEMGFTVHGVVTPADVGYFRDGKPQPMGAAYRDLIEPLMTSYQRFRDNYLKKQGITSESAFDPNREEDFRVAFDAYRARPKQQIAYWRARREFENAANYAGCMGRLAKGETQDLPVATLSIQRKGTQDVQFISDEELDAFVTRSELRNRDGQMVPVNPDDYHVSVALNPDDTMTLTGNQAGAGSGNVQGKDQMMQKAAGELGQGVSIFFADDSPAYLSGASLVMENYIRAGLVSLTTCLVPRNYQEAVSVKSGLHYQRAIEHLSQSLPQAKTAVDEGIRAMTDQRLSRAIRDKRVRNVRENLALANSKQVTALAPLARQGGNLLFDSPSLNTAYTLLVIAFLKAISPEEAEQAKQALQQFLRDHPALDTSPVDGDVSRLSGLLYDIACNEAAVSPIARQLLERSIEVQEQLLGVLPSDSPEYQQAAATRDAYQAILADKPPATAIVAEALPTHPLASSRSPATPGSDSVPSPVSLASLASGSRSPTEAIAYALYRISEDETATLRSKRIEAKWIRANLSSANSQQLMTMAHLATQGDNALFQDASLKTAYKCLVMAYLKALSPEEEKQMLGALQQFLSVHWSELNEEEKKNQTQENPNVTVLESPNAHTLPFDLLLDNLYAKATDPEATDSPIARQLLERSIEVQRQLLDVLPPDSPEYRQAMAAIEVVAPVPTRPIASGSLPTTPNPARVPGTMFSRSVTSGSTGPLPAADPDAPASAPSTH